MNKKELKTIEEKLTDTVIADGVLDKARAEMQKSEPKPKKPVRFNYKILLSCVASFILCLAIILPISFSLFDKDNSEKLGSDSDQSGRPQAPGDNDPSSSGDSVTLPSIFALNELNKSIIFEVDQDNETGDGEPQPPSDPDMSGVEIVYKAHYLYSFKNMDIISEEKYTVNGCKCVVYTLYNLEHTVDVLGEFNDFDFKYSTEKLTFNYIKTSDRYLADTVCGLQRYSFKINTAEQSDFEKFCIYLSEKISK